jgi:TonB family protein
MKRCHSCQEEFSDKFSFCPVCGAPLSVIRSEPVASVQNMRDESIAPSPSSIKPTVAASDFYATHAGNIEEAVTESFVSDEELERNGHNVAPSFFNSAVAEEESLVTESFEAGGDGLSYSSGASSNFVSHEHDEEYHLTFLDDKGVTRRLVEEVAGVARESQLTWPELKKDPVGFVKRSFNAYGQAFLGFLSNRSVMTALGASVVIMGGLVAVAFLLDRTKSTTTSKIGIGLFSVAAAILLIGIFASWMTSEGQDLQQGAVSGTRQRVTASSSPWYLVAGLLTVLGIPVLFFAILALVFIFGLRSPTVAANNPNENLELVGEIPIPEEEKKEEGNPGNNKGDGGGSKPKPEKPGGGGGGGREETKPASQGKIPQGADMPPIIPVTPDPPRMKNPSLPTPVTINADPTLFPPDNRDVAYGDPKSKSTDPSSGPGKNGGMGDGKDGGLGPGEGEGYGPGRGRNTGGGDPNDGGGGPGGGGGTDYSKTFQPREVQQKAQITAKPQPEYTEDARKNQIQGVVRVSMVLSSSGSVQNIRAVSSLPYGLTEKAIAAARRIQFVPAKKDGRSVSQYITVEYKFTIY